MSETHFSSSLQSEVCALLKKLQGGPLRNLTAMRQFCITHPKAYMKGRQPFYTFRIDTSENRYYLRIFPQEEKASFSSFVTGQIECTTICLCRKNTKKKRKERDR